MTPEDPLDGRWPNAGDCLFRASDWKYDAPIVSDPAERLYRLPMGYKRAGDVLVEQAEQDLVDRKNIIYAALFCYRQSVELFLKGSINQFGDSQSLTTKHTHDLSLLWTAFKTVVLKRSAEIPSVLDTVEDLVMEMHQADAKSDGFRYPLGQRGMPFQFGDRGIDLQNLREVMSGVANFFECARLEFAEQDNPEP
jgi:hypothetical protein